MTGGYTPLVAARGGGIPRDVVIGAMPPARARPPAPDAPP
jgi:uncharacterized membrane protein YeiH